MNDDVKAFHSSTLSAYNKLMFESLIHRHNITTESPKAYQFEDKDGVELSRMLRGYFAMKEDCSGTNHKYFIQEKHHKELPLRVNDYEEIFYKDSAKSKSVVRLPTRITPFRIKPENTFNNFHDFINNIAPFSHSHPTQWTLNKIIAVMGLVGKTFVGVCSKPEGGKSSIYTVLHSLTKECPVFKPRSVPGILAQITGVGNMVFDDIHSVPPDVKRMLEEFSFSAASGEPSYINGALKSKNTRMTYDLSNQSITFLYNTLNDYSSQEVFWDHLWDGKKAMKSRFLALRFEGKLTQEFNRDYSIPDAAEANKSLYISIAKHLLWLRVQKADNTYRRRYKSSEGHGLEGRHKICYDELTWGIDAYSTSQEMYDHYIQALNHCIESYKGMLRGDAVKPGVFDTYVPMEEETIKEEPLIKELSVLEKSEKILLELKNGKVMGVEELEKATGIQDIDSVLDKLKEEGTIYEPFKGKVKLL